jgi:hypothetical protein
MNGLFRVFASFGMVVFGAGSSFAQSGWFWQNPLPQDAGAHWMPQGSWTSNFLRGVSCVDVNTCTAVGNFGTILRTNTGGE